MQIDMHFYGVYALARAAGIKQDCAVTIAGASQYVDDSLDDEAIVLKDQRAVLPTMSSHKPVDYENSIPGDQWKVWVPFHFLPGNDPSANSFVEKMVCRKNSEPAKKILKHALSHVKSPMGLHMAGVTAHVYADTFAHYGFVGLSKDWNKVKNDTVEVKVKSKTILSYISSKFESFKTRIAGKVAEAIPVGHGAVATFPDRPYLKWKYVHENGVVVNRDNVLDYMDACKNLHAFFGNVAKGNPAYGSLSTARTWGNIKDEIKKILVKEADKEERIKAWKKAISGNKLFKATNKDKAIEYQEAGWKSAQIAYHFDKKEKLDACDAYYFCRAAWIYRDYVLHKLLPDIDVIAT